MVVQNHTFKREMDMTQQEEARAGVYICHYEGNISDMVDVEKVKEASAKLIGVKVAETYEYMCSDPVQEMITNGIKEHGLNRIEVASCSPRMHLDTVHLFLSKVKEYLFVCRILSTVSSSSFSVLSSFMGIFSVSHL